MSQVPGLSRAMVGRRRSSPDQGAHRGLPVSAATSVSAGNLDTALPRHSVTPTHAGARPTPFYWVGETFDKWDGQSWIELPTAPWQPSIRGHRMSRLCWRAPSPSAESDPDLLCCQSHHPGVPCESVYEVWFPTSSSSTRLTAPSCHLSGSGKGAIYTVDSRTRTAASPAVLRQAHSGLARPLGLEKTVTILPHPYPQVAGPGPPGHPRRGDLNRLLCSRSGGSANTCLLD